MEMSRSIRALCAAVLALVLAATVAPFAAAEPGAPGPDQAPARALPGGQSEDSVTVTLVTGDRVTLIGGDPRRSTIQPGPGRADVTFQRVVDGDRLLVIPADVHAQIASGRLDRRLFDVTGLIDIGYDDAQADSIRLIVSQRGRAARGTLTGAGAEQGVQLPAIDGGAFAVDKAEAGAFFESLPQTAKGFGGGIDRIWLDGRARVTLDLSVPQIGAPDAWEAGFTGQGIKVAVVDTGIDASHPDLTGKVAARKDFSGEGPADGYGHGTHVASTIAGSGAASGGKYKGVAPDATLLDSKVCTADGMCDDSAIIAGLTWAADEQDADVVNVSLGGYDTPEVDPMEEAVNTLTAETGALFVISAGNEGPGPSTIGTPGSADAALTVGAVRKSDGLAGFSSRGPRTGDGAIKPDLTAPGVGVIAARAKGTSMGNVVSKRYVAASGTSMAAPHTAGAAALLAQQHPDWEPAQLKATLMASADPLPRRGAFEQGTGRVDLSRAIGQTVVAETPSVSFPTALWPHGDDEPVTETLTYRNLGDADVTLGLTARLFTPKGKDAPVGALTLSEESVTVPAGGTASVDVVSDTNHAGRNGAYGGRVVAKGGGTRVVTAVGVDKEPERYDLTLRAVDRDGDPGQLQAIVIALDGGFQAFPSVASGEVTLRVPLGRYSISGLVTAAGEAADEPVALLAQPVFRVSGDTVWTADARKAKAIAPQVQDKDVRLAHVSATYWLYGEDTYLGVAYSTPGEHGVFAGHLGRSMKGTPWDLSANLDAELAVPGDDGGFDDSPVIYKLVDTRGNRFWDGYEKSFRNRDLATVETAFSGHADERRATTQLWGMPFDDEPMMGGEYGYDLPAKVTVRSTPSPAGFYQTLSVYAGEKDAPSTVLITPRARAYDAGKTYRARFNAAPFGPGQIYGERYGRFIYVDAPMFSDQDGHLGWSLAGRQFTTLHRGKTLVKRSGQAGFIFAEGLPRTSAKYKLTASAKRGSHAPLSTEQRTVWTFRSRAADRGRLPLWTASFAPKLDARNRAKAGGEAKVPLVLRAPRRGPVGKPKTVEVEVSTNDGQSWRKAKVKAKGERSYVVTVRTPAGAEYVSLRVAVTDTAGNKLRQRTIRAYALK